MSSVPLLGEGVAPRESGASLDHPDRRPAVLLSRASRLFGAHAALVGIDLEVRAGEVLLLYGPNGAGKTTLLRLIATAISPTYGTGEVLGFDLARERHHVRARTELVGHRTRLYEDLTPAEYLRFVATLWGQTGVSTVEALARTGLAGVAGERIRELSQGMRQRLALARAFLRHPQLILLDEPYAALDDAARELVDALVAETKLDGRTVIVATHDTGRAARFADRGVRLEAGRIAADGLPGAGGA